VVSRSSSDGVVVSRIFNMHIEVAASDDWTSVCNQYLQHVGQLSEERAERRARWSVDAQNDEGPATDEKPEAQSFERRQSWQCDPVGLVMSPVEDGDTTVARISLADGIGDAVVSRARQLQADVGAGVMPCSVATKISRHCEICFCHRLSIIYNEKKLCQFIPLAVWLVGGLA